MTDLPPLAPKLQFRMPIFTCFHPHSGRLSQIETLMWQTFHLSVRFERYNCTYNHQEISNKKKIIHRVVTHSDKSSTLKDCLVNFINKLSIYFCSIFCKNITFLKIVVTNLPLLWQTFHFTVTDLPPLSDRPSIFEWQIFHLWVTNLPLYGDKPSTFKNISICFV